MCFYLCLAWRNVWRQRRRTLIIAFAMGIIVALLTIYDGMLGGFEQAIYGNAIQLLGGNLQIHAPGYNAKIGRKPLLPLADPDGLLRAAADYAEVTAAAQRVVTQGIVTNREGAFAVTILGVDPVQEARFSPVAHHLTYGRYLTSEASDQAVIGQGLATAMNLGLGDRFSMAASLNHDQLRQRTLTVVGIYDVGVPSIEKTTIYISLAEAQSLFGLNGQATEVVVSLKSVGQEAAVLHYLNSRMPGYEISTWMDSFPDLKQTMDLKTAVMSVFGLIMLCVAAIGILNLQMMAVFERTREIGVLGALGMQPGGIMLLFLLEGALIGLIGALLGSVIGTLVNALLSYVGIDYASFADLTEYTALISGRIYSQVTPLKTLQHSLTTLVIATLAAYLPARDAARREPAAALHHV